MPLDAIFLSALTRELNETLTGSRIDRVQQPERDAVLLSLRGREGGCRLLLSASPNHPRIQLTQERFENPAQPPMFCMLLRKHLGGGRVLSLRQQPLERAVTLTVEAADELGVLTEKRLILELMGRNANLILTDAEGRILDCLRRVDLTMSTQRQLLPGLFYRIPPAQEKLDPHTADADVLAALLAGPGDATLDRRLTAGLCGVSPLIARELSYRCTGRTDARCKDCDPSALAETLRTLLAEPRPVLLREGETPKEFSYCPITQYEDYLQAERPASFSALLDAFYGERSRAERLRQRAQVLHKTATNYYARVTRKLEAQRKELAAATDRERLRQFGDLVSANLYQIVRGQTRLTVADLYDPELREVEIPLNAALSPQQNAARYYKEYTKARNAERALTAQIAAGEREQAYLASVLSELALAESERELGEIRQELLEGGYLKDTQKRKQMKIPPTRPMEFRSSDGLTILVGRNNRQNDLLTLKTAAKSDLWLHVRKTSGSHAVIVCGGAEIPERTLTEAATLAAYYSQARQGQKVPVDYCPVRQVKKPAGAKPGMVVYENYRTCYVTPDPKLPARLAAETGA